MKTDQNVLTLILIHAVHGCRNGKKGGGDIWEEYLLNQNSGIEGMYTYSIVPGLGKQRRERENTVNMRERGSVEGVQRDMVVGNIMTEEKKGGKTSGVSTVALICSWETRGAEYDSSSRH